MSEEQGYLREEQGYLREEQGIDKEQGFLEKEHRIFGGKTMISHHVTQLETYHWARIVARYSVG